MTLLTSTNLTRPARPTGWVPFALVALVAIPAVAGSLRLVVAAPPPPALAPATGRVVVALGLLVALSGLWMTLFHARQPGALLALGLALGATAAAVPTLVGRGRRTRRSAPAGS